MAATVVAVFCSVWRPGPVVFDAITAALADPVIDEVLVYGYEPTGYATALSMPHTEYHVALERWGTSGTLDVLCSSGKFCGVDSRNRTKWRSRLAIDMWACLTSARALRPDAALVWLENDAVLIPGALGRAVLAATRTGAAACWGFGSFYSGDGNLCFVFYPSVDPTPHLLSYHLVQPADWILSDYSKKQWPIVKAVTHGITGTHTSTRLL